MIIKTVKNINSGAGCIVSGVSFRAQRERNGYRFTSGELKGIFVPEASAIILSDVVLNEEGRIPRGQKYA